MIELFRSWINSMLSIGIFVLFVKLIIPKNNLSRYIYSLIGIITIVSVISPVVKIAKNDDIKSSLNEVLDNISKDSFASVDTTKYQDVSSEAVKKTFSDKLCSDIKDKLEAKGVSVGDVKITLDDEYNIVMVEVVVNNNTYSNSIVEFLKEEYGVENVNVRGE